MIVNHLRILATLRWQDVVDILFLTTLAYHLYVWFWGTKAVKALVGLLALGIVFLMARSWGLFLTTWFFQILWQVLVILLIILFQAEIRQVLERFSPFHVIRSRLRRGACEWIKGLAEAAFSMAEQRIGALLVIEQRDRVDQWVLGGVPLNCDVSPEILLTIFQKSSPLHDGALLLRGERADRAAAFLPLSMRDGLPKEWGTRHRAAAGLSERCDAWVVVVSEERGRVSLAHGGSVREVADRDDLCQLLSEALTPPDGVGVPLLPRWGRLITLRWPAKLGALCGVCLLWVLLAGQQDVEVTVHIPVETTHLPEQMEIVEPVNAEVQVTVRGLRKDAMSLNESNVHAELDLTLARLGRRTFRITRDQILIPNDRVQVLKIEPAEVKFKLKERS